MGNGNARLRIRDATRKMLDLLNWSCLVSRKVTRSKGYTDTDYFYAKFAAFTNTCYFQHCSILSNFWKEFFKNFTILFVIFTDRPKAPYLLIDSRRLDAGNIFVPVKENSELNLACVSEGGNPRPTLTWEVLLSPGVDRHAQKISAEVLDLEELKSEKVSCHFKNNLL